MDSIFHLPEGDRASFLKQIMQSFGCVYICLWSYLPPPSNCLLALDGLYGEISNQPNGPLVRRLFDVYRESVIYINVDTGRIPGLAFKNNIPYMELKLQDFQRLVSGEAQLQFYQEAGIKTVVFMGCATGEIELGMPNDPQVDLEREMNKLISVQGLGMSDPNHPPSSSSSSLRSLSVDSPEYSPLLFNNNNIPSTSFVQEPLKQPLIRESVHLEEALRSVSEPTTSTTRPHDRVLSLIRSVQIPSIESEDAAMTKAILAVLSSPSTPSSSQQTTEQNLSPLSKFLIHNPTAFRRYRATSSRSIPGTAIPTQKQNKFKRAVLFFRNLNWSRRQDQFQVQGNRPTVTQLHHMISERRRREKLNESFHVLRSLLPPGSKKDKASVLSSTTEYLSSLKSQVAELVKNNQMLKSQLLAQNSEASLDQVWSSCSGERVNVEITRVSSSTSEARFLDVTVSVRGERNMLDLVIGVIEFLKQQRNASLLSVESNTRVLGSVPTHGLMLRLKIEGDDFDDSGFEEGVRRVVDDQTH